MEQPEKKSYIILALVLAGFFVYVNALPNAFVWDDEEQIVNNVVIKQPANLLQILASSTFYAGGAGLTGGFYRPMVSLSYLINYQIWGLMPFGFHIFQVILHILNSIMVFYLLEIILSREKVELATEKAVLAALFFSVHPANVESVAYIASIGETLYVFFILLAMLIFIKGIDHEDREISGKNLFLTFFLILFGLLSKEAAIIAPPLLFVYLLLFVKPKTGEYYRFFMATGAVGAAYVFLRFAVARIPASLPFLTPIAQASFFEKLITIPYTIVSYCKVIFWPIDLSISRQFVVSSAADARFYASLLFLMSVVMAGAYCFYKMRLKLGFFFSLWFLASLAPTLGIINMDMTMAERWLYFPAIGIFALAGMLIVSAIQKLPKNRHHIGYAIALTLILALSARTVIRNADWKNGLTLFCGDIDIVQKVSPSGSFDLENNCGVELFRQGNYAEAERHFSNSIALQPKWTYSHNNLGAVLEHKGDFEGALDQYTRSIILGDYYRAYENSGNIMIRMKRYDAAENFIIKARQKYPANMTLKFQLATVYAFKGDRNKAIPLLEEIQRNNPGNIEVNRIYAILQASQ